jgi:plasmid stabilization system protein ParE
MRIRWSVAAERDLQETFDYLLDRSPRAADRIASRIKARVEGRGRHAVLGAARRPRSHADVGDQGNAVSRF